MENKKKKSFLKEYLITSAISLVVGIGLFLLFYFAIDNGGFVGAIDGTGITGAILISIGLLIYISREGFFDIFAYGFKQAGSMIFGKKGNENNDFPKYLEDKRVERETKSKYFLFIIIVGLLFILVFAVLEIIFHSQY